MINLYTRYLGNLLDTANLCLEDRSAGSHHIGFEECVVGVTQTPGGRP
jgi:hypothetical protein